MDLKLKSKTALVSGGSEGIGKAIALALAKEGVDVAICARRKEPLESAAKESHRSRLGTVTSTQIHGLCALPSICAPAHGRAGGWPCRQPHR
jgi:NAD(P)-dependent dehydrogenase (short-subunit alcohol dehydrogenase family)